MTAGRKRREGFTILDNAAASDQRLSSEALALLVFVASHDQTQFQIRRTLILSRFNWTKNRYYAARDLASKLGYLSTEDTRKKGEFSSPKFHINWTPDAAPPCPKKKDTAKSTVSCLTGHGVEGHIRRTTSKNTPVANFVDDGEVVDLQDDQFDTE